MKQAYSGEIYIWSLAQAARAKAVFAMAHYPPTWQGLEALQRAVQMSGKPVPDEGPKDTPWAKAAFADAEARFNWKYEQVVA